MVPVNLRKFFPSDSMLNFFSWIESGYHFGEKAGTFEEILAQVKTDFKDKLTKEKIAEHMNELIALEMHPVLKFAPAELKNLCIHAGAKFSEKNTTAIFSNMSSVVMPGEYVPYIERFGVYTSTPKMELCVCSFGDQLSLGFTSRFDTENIQRNFYPDLKRAGDFIQIGGGGIPGAGDTAGTGNADLQDFHVSLSCCDRVYDRLGFQLQTDRSLDVVYGGRYGEYVACHDDRIF